MKLLVAFIFLCLWCRAQAKCVMRGHCAEIGGHPKNCKVDMEAIPLTEGLSEEEADESRAIFANRCPWFVLDKNGNLKPHNEILTCCDPVQLKYMSDSLAIVEGLLGRCPTCFRNFARQICEMNCSPNQSNFVEAIVGNPDEDEEAHYVDTINYKVYGQFMDDAHASCAGVIVPQTGLPAIYMMCGNAIVCDADAWFGFTGDTTQNPLALVQTNFIRSDTTENSMSVRAPPCNETAEGDLPCSCVDCLAICPVVM